MTHIMDIPLQHLLSATIPVQSFHPHHPITCVTETHSIFTSSIPQPLTLASSTILSFPSYSITSQVIAVTKAEGRGKVLDSAHIVNIQNRLKVIAVIGAGLRMGHVRPWNVYGPFCTLLRVVASVDCCHLSLLSCIVAIASVRHGALEQLVQGC